MLARIRAILHQFTWMQLLLIAIAFVVVYALVFAICFPTWHRYNGLIHEGAHTSGSVIAKEPQNHGSIRYQYSVGGPHYERTVNTGYAGIAPLDEFQIGQSVSVTYWTKRPGVSTVGDPRKQLEVFLGPIIGMPLAFALFTAGAVALTLKRTTGEQVIAYLTRRSS